MNIWTCLQFLAHISFLALILANSFLFSFSILRQFLDYFVIYIITVLSISVSLVMSSFKNISVHFSLRVRSKTANLSVFKCKFLSDRIIKPS